MLQSTPDCRSLIYRDGHARGGIRFGAVPSNERVFGNVKKKRRSGSRSALGMAVDCIGPDLPRMPRKSRNCSTRSESSEALRGSKPTSPGRGSHDLLLCSI